MKNIFLALLFVSIASVGFAQNWTTHNANNQRNGLTEMTGIQDLDHTQRIQSSVCRPSLPHHRRHQPAESVNCCGSEDG